MHLFINFVYGVAMASLCIMIIIVIIVVVVVPEAIKTN